MRASQSICAQARTTGSSYSPLEKHKHSSCLRAPLVLSVYKHKERVLLITILIIITIHRAHVRLSLFLHESTNNGVFFSFYREEFLFVMLARDYFIYAREHDERGLILVLSRRITVRRACFFRTDRYEALIFPQLKESNRAGVKLYGLAPNYTCSGL